MTCISVEQTTERQMTISFIRSDVKRLYMFDLRTWYVHL